MTRITAPHQLTKSRILVDTDVVSYIFKRDTLAKYFRPFLLHRTLAIAFVSVTQLYYGAFKANWGVGRLNQLENHIKNYVVLPYDFLLCQKCAQLRVKCESEGYRIEFADAWIGASALRFDCALATNNTRHFINIDGIELISPGFDSLL
jgi:tRNA(fMet)-specific endonuclease VapC